MVEFNIQNKGSGDVLSYIDYKADGSKNEGQVASKITGGAMNPDEFISLFEQSDLPRKFAQSSQYNDSFQKLYAFNPNIGSSMNAVKVSVNQNSDNYGRYCQKLDDACYGMDLENSEVAKTNHLKNFKSFIAMTATVGLVVGALGFSVLVADHNYDIKETIDTLMNPKSSSETLGEDMKTSDEILQQMVSDDDSYHATRK